MNKRQARILKALYQAQGFMTLAEIARQMDVSVKTIRNDITAVNQFLEARQVTKLEAKPHLGIRCNMSQTEWEYLKNSDHQPDGREEQEILFYIIWQLLRRGNLTAQKLSEQYYISRVQLDKILTEAQNWFSKYHILFERRRGLGIQIHYCEYHYRLAMRAFYEQFENELYDPMQTRSSRYASVDSKEYTALTILLNGFDIDGIIEVVNDLEAKFGIHFSYPANVSLLIYLSLCIVRSRNGYLVGEIPSIPCQIDGASDALLCQTLINLLEKQFQIKLDPCEHQFLLFCVSISEIQNFYDDQARREFEYQNIPLCRLTVKFVHLISDVTDIDFRQDRFFLHQMLLQLRTMIGRLKFQIPSHNPLLRQIKAKYPEILAMIWSAVGIFEKELQFDLTEDDIGFLALLVGGAIERSLSKIKACIVCEYGVGVSQILKEKIERSVGFLTITEVLSKGDVRILKQQSCDFIISTVPLDNKIAKDIVIVDHLLNDDDIQKIQLKMKEIRKKKVFGHQKKAIQKNSLFTQELIYPDLDITKKEQLLHLLCTKMKNLGYVSAPFEESVLNRESITSTEVGNGIAIPHGHCNFVNRSVIAFAKLSRPIRWFGEEEVDLVFLLAVDLDDKCGMKDEIIKFYKLMVHFMEDGPQKQQLRDAKDTASIIKIFQNW